MKRNLFVILGVFFAFGVFFSICCSSCSNENGRPRAKVVNPSTTKGMDSASLSMPIQMFSVYLENSGSMHGYVKGNTGFEQFLYYYLTRVQNREMADSISLNYINDRVIPLRNHVEKFIHGIEPEDFARKGGNTGTSDIAVVLDTILERHQKDEISMFISDCIVSPGKGAKDIENYLREQRTKIENSFVSCLKKVDGDLTVIICQLTSEFDGKFYNKYDAGIKYKGNRPFYVWLIGNNHHIKQLLDAIPLKEIADLGADIENMYVLMSGHKPIDYRILLSPKWGDFRPDRKSLNPQTTICDVEKEKKGTRKGFFMFSIGVNLADLPLDDDYILDAANYDISSKDYKVTVQESQRGIYSHIISLSSQIVTRGTVYITLTNQFPQWAIDKTDTIGENLVKDQAEDKTFGLKYLVEGCYNAFKKHQDYAKLKVTIK